LRLKPAEKIASRFVIRWGVQLRALLVIPALVLFCVAGCNRGDTTTSTVEPMPDSGITALQIDELTEGTGAIARKGQTVRVHYTGWLYDPSQADKRGRAFDSSRSRNEPYEFRLGLQEVIAGWDEGVAGMKVGGVRVLTIPPAMGYGGASAGGGVIPPNATLVFEVELIDVR
jgi:FKBP-type peptidyl-prolyl cis-trans isomerase FkpA